MERTSLAEFTVLVHGLLLECLSRATEETVTAYLEEPETKEIIEDQYRCYTQKGFTKLVYHVGTVTYNLYMLF